MEAPVFERLEAALVGTGPNGEDDVPLQVNSLRPVRIETPFFSGHILLCVRTEKPGDDPFYHKRIFEGKTRRFELQLQGRFKRIGDGVLYMGGEIGLRQMQLGLLTKGEPGQRLVVPRTTVLCADRCLVAQVLPEAYSTCCAKSTRCCTTTLATSRASRLPASSSLCGVPQTVSL